MSLEVALTELAWAREAQAVAAVRVTRCEEWVENERELLRAALKKSEESTQ